MEVTYIDMYKQMHEDPNLYEGSALVLHAERIKNIIVSTQAKTLLDYGCGKGDQYHKEKLHDEYLRGILPTLYDPAVEQYSVKPTSTFDGVICTDVLEHIPEDQLAEVIKELISYADKFVYLGICNTPAKSFLPNGENSHVTLKSFDWWVDFIQPFANDKYVMIYVYGTQIGSTRGTCIIDKNEIKLRKEL